MRYTESIPDFRFLEESIGWVGQKLVSSSRQIGGSVGRGLAAISSRVYVMIEKFVFLSKNGVFTLCRINDHR
jgi:hypothetical protein